MNLVADNELCEAHGQCAAVDDALFTLDEEGYIAIGGSLVVPPEKEEAARLGVASCPMGTLRIE